MKTTFPDTVWLPSRAQLAINCLSGCLNPRHDYLPFCLMDVSSDLPRMRHTQFDWSDHTSRVIDALLLAKELSGSAAGDETLDRLLPLFWGGFKEDGLHYTPANPWSFEHANMHYQRSVLNALLSLALAGNSDRAHEQARKLAYKLGDIAIAREGYRYFPSVEYLPDGWPRGDWGILGFGVDPANTSGRLLFGLARLYELLDDERIADVAGGFVRQVMHASSAYLADGSFATGIEFREGHFHSRAVTMLGVIRFGAATKDASAIEWGRRVFERARCYGTRFGWFPERLVESGAHGCETCAIVDMMEAAIWLARSGYSQYWGDAERYLRNHLLESQMTSVDWCHHVTEEHGRDEWETTVDVANRSLGGFAGWSQPNDLISKVMHEWDLYTCCCGQGVRGLFNAWSNAARAEKGRLWINLLINCHNDSATVRSWLPDVGRVEITPANNTAVALRIPEGVDPRNVTAAIGDRSVTLRTPHAHFIESEVVKSGQSIVFEFPVPNFRITERVVGVDYESTWRGDTVVSITPHGERCALYNDRVIVERAGRREKRKVDLPHIRFEL